MHITHKELIDVCSKRMTQRAYTKLCDHSSRISKNGTRVETRYVEICT